MTKNIEYSAPDVPLGEKQQRTGTYHGPLKQDACFSVQEMLHEELSFHWKRPEPSEPEVPEEPPMLSDVDALLCSPSPAEP